MRNWAGASLQCQSMIIRNTIILYFILDLVLWRWAGCRYKVPERECPYIPAYLSEGIVRDLWGHHFTSPWCFRSIWETGVLQFYGSYTEAGESKYRSSLRPKAAWQFLWNRTVESIVWNIIEEELLIETLPTTLLRIFCNFILNFKIIAQSIIDPDDNFLENS